MSHPAQCLTDPEVFHTHLQGLTTTPPPEKHSMAGHSHHLLYREETEALGAKRKRNKQKGPRGML